MGIGAILFGPGLLGQAGRQTDRSQAGGWFVFMTGTDVRGWGEGIVIGKGKTG